MSIREQITVEFTCADMCACLHNFVFLCVDFLCSAACNLSQNFACACTKNWQQTEIAHVGQSHMAAHSTPDFSITSKRGCLPFFLIHSTLEFMSWVKTVDLTGTTWSPLTISESEGEALITCCTHLKSCTCSTTWMNIKAWLSIFTCNSHISRIEVLL